jgi:hypothetical protein
MRTRLLLAFFSAILIHSGTVIATETVVRPTATDPSGGETGGNNASISNPSQAYDGNTATHAGMSVSRPWTLGAGLTYAQFTFVGFPAGTPVSMRVRFSAYADGAAGCPARWYLDYYDGMWRTWLNDVDDAAGYKNRSADWSPTLYLPGIPGAGVVRVRARVEAERTSCGFSGTTANMHIYEIEQTVDDCARVMNFAQNGNGSDVGGGLLQFNYTFQSSTGDLSDLAACSLWENLLYNPRPFDSPPFPADWPDPDWNQHSNPDSFVFGVNPVGGVLSDGHNPPGAGTWVTPYTTSTGTIAQYYEFSCPCFNSGAKTVVDGPYTITRTVTQNPNSTWKYTVTKAGASATVNPLP